MKQNLKTYAEGCGIPLGRKRLVLAKGNADDVGNNILVVCEPQKNMNWFSSKADKYAISILEKYEMPRYFLTASHLLPLKSVGREDIKAFSTWVQKITDLLEPRLIVLLGEHAEFCFLRRKFILRDYHGTEIGRYNGIPLLLTYPMSYYLNSVEYVDPGYKQFLENNDWTLIKERYDACIRPKNE